MFKISKSLYLALALVTIQLPILGHKKSKDQVIALLKGNEHNARSAAKQVGLAKPDSFKLLVIQPTPKLKRIDKFVDGFKGGIQKTGHTMSKMEKRHLTLMTFHIPFQWFPGDGQLTRDKANRQKYAQNALKRLASIVEKHIQVLRGVNFNYTHFGTLVGGKHLVAFHDFQSQQDQQKFYAAYDAIVQEFLAAYPDCWMSVPYEFKPHVTVATHKGKSERHIFNVPGQGRGAFENTITLGFRKKKNAQPSPMRVSASCKGTLIKSSVFIP